LSNLLYPNLRGYLLYFQISRCYYRLTSCRVYFKLVSRHLNSFLSSISTPIVGVLPLIIPKPNFYTFFVFIFGSYVLYSNLYDILSYDSRFILNNNSFWASKSIFVTLSFPLSLPYINFLTFSVFIFGSLVSYNNLYDILSYDSWFISNNNPSQSSKPIFMTLTVPPTILILPFFLSSWGFLIKTMLFRIYASSMYVIYVTYCIIFGCLLIFSWSPSLLHIWKCNNMVQRE